MPLCLLPSIFKSTLIFPNSSISIPAMPSSYSIWHCLICHLVPRDDLNHHHHKLLLFSLSKSISSAPASPSLPNAFFSMLANSVWSVKCAVETKSDRIHPVRKRNPIHSCSPPPSLPPCYPPFFAALLIFSSTLFNAADRCWCLCLDLSWSLWIFSSIITDFVDPSTSLVLVWTTAGIEPSSA